MRFRPANIRLINRRSKLPRLRLALSSINGKSNNKNNPTNVQRLTGHSISEQMGYSSQSAGDDGSLISRPQGPGLKAISPPAIALSIPAPPTSCIRSLGCCCTYVELRNSQRVRIIFRQMRLEISFDVVADPELSEKIDHP